MSSSRPRPLTSLAGLTFTALLLCVGCKQGLGERCEVDSDCQGGLTCDNPLGTAGVCADRTVATAPRADAAPREASRADVTALDSAAPDATADRVAADTGVMDGPLADSPSDAVGDAAADTRAVD